MCFMTLGTTSVSEFLSAHAQSGAQDGTEQNNRLTTIRSTQWHNSSMYMWEIMCFLFFLFFFPFLLSFFDCGRSGSCSCSGFWVSAAWQNLRGMLRFDFCHIHTVLLITSFGKLCLPTLRWPWRICKVWHLVKGDTRLYIETCKHGFRENSLLQYAYYVLC